MVTYKTQVVQDKYKTPLQHQTSQHHSNVKFKFTCEITTSHMKYFSSHVKDRISHAFFIRGRKDVRLLLKLDKM